MKECCQKKSFIIELALIVIRKERPSPTTSVERKFIRQLLFCFDPHVDVVRRQLSISRWILQLELMD